MKKILFRPGRKPSSNAKDSGKLMPSREPSPEAEKKAEGVLYGESELSKIEALEFFFAYYVAEIADSMGMSQSELGRRAFGDKSGSRTWRGVRSIARRRNLTLGDCFAIAEAFDTDLATLLWRFLQKAEETDLDAFIREAEKEQKIQGEST